MDYEDMLLSPTKTLCSLAPSGEEAQRPKTAKSGNSELPGPSPCLPMLPGLEVNTPAYIGDVARLVSKIRMEPLSLMAQASTSNGCRLYGTT